MAFGFTSPEEEQAAILSAIQSRSTSPTTTTVRSTPSPGSTGETFEDIRSALTPQSFTSPTRTPAPSTSTPTRATTSGLSSGAASAVGAAPSPSADPRPGGGRALNLDEINAALEAISAMFAAQEGELTAEQQAARQAFQFLRDSIFRSRDLALEQQLGDFAGRGIARSGIALEQQARLAEQASTQVSHAQAQKAARERAIERQIATLEATEERQRAEEARRLANEQVGTQEAIARALQLV